MLYDYKRDVLGGQYRDDHPVRNWLMYRLKGKDCDKIALADELDQVQAAGFRASPDTMNSFWTTYKRAIQIWYGDTFALRHPVNNVQRLVELYDSGAYAEVNILFAPFAMLTHAPGNFLLVPVYINPKTARPNQATNFNLVRNRTKSDYWDLTLGGIKDGEFRAFFENNPVAPQFNIAAMPGGFTEFIERNRLEIYIGSDGEVAPLWPGHLDAGAKNLPQTKGAVREFIRNVCHAIEHRTEALTHAD